MATQLQPPQPELVSQENEERGAHPVDDFIENTPPKPKRSIAVAIKHYRKNSVHCRPDRTFGRRHSGLGVPLLL